MSGVPAGARKLGAGVYAAGGEMHIDLEELVVASGGNPSCERDCQLALAAVRRVFQEEARAAGTTIPMEVRLKDD